MRGLLFGLLLAHPLTGGLCIAYWADWVRPGHQAASVLPRQVAAQKRELSELQRAWTQFAKAILRNSEPAIRALSADCIVREGHPARQVALSTFLTQNKPLLYSASVRARLLKPEYLRYNLANEQNKPLYHYSCIASAAEFKTAKIQEVLVTVVDPYPASPGEGMQLAFAFIKTKDGYKFCGCSTIP